ncbi:unnamed protein product [Lupinus luteus]|uniref:Uncharacterized protein n=1 Tax=Lupinus luteus TaxID=3873 RepID=A0AAV1XPW0_LUPLU
MNQNSLKQVPTFNPMLKESINRFLSQYRKGATDFTDFTSIFSRMLNTFPDPPIQIIWFYSALEFNTIKLAATSEPSRRIAAAKDLFQLLVSCSDSCGPVKRIAVLAPLVSELYQLGVHEKEMKSEVEGLLERVISYCSILCGEALRGEDGMEILEADLVDLIEVWMVGEQFFRAEDCVIGFFPFASEEFRKGVRVGCEIGLLAGVVMCEVLFLKMCLSFEFGITKVEVEQKLHGSAVQTISGFRNFYFLDALFRMMLEPVLPVISVLGSENEVFLKDVLYNAVMMIEHSFINPQAGVSLYANSLKDLAVTWLFVADSAIQSAREKGDHGKALSYVNAFSISCVPIQLINWVTQSGVGRKISRPNVSTPIALINWLLDVEDQGLAKHRAKANFFALRTNCMLPAIKHFVNSLDKNYFSDSTHGETQADKLDGDIEMVDSVDPVSFDSGCRVRTTSTDGTRKRKEGIEDETKTQLKFMRCQFHENPVRENPLIFRQQ